MAAPVKQCGQCSECCRILSVAEIGLKAYEGCKFRRTVIHAAGPCCAIYARRPHSCRTWSCGWLKSPDLPDELRPDRCGFVIDEHMDLVVKDGKDADAAQIWVAPGHEEDWRTPLATAVIQALLQQQASAVLWRMKGGKARGFALDAESGGIAFTEATPYVGENDPLNDEVARERRLNTLIEDYRKRGKR